MPNQIQAIALLPKLSEQQLLQVLQQNDGSVPSYAVMAELQARKKRSAGLAGPQMPTTSVKDDMTQEAAGGLQSLGPAPMAPQMQRGMAEGGMPRSRYDDQVTGQWNGNGYGFGEPEGRDFNPFLRWGRHYEEEALRTPWNVKKKATLDKSAMDHVANIRESEAEDRARRGKAVGGLLGPGLLGPGLLGPDEYEFPPETVDRPLGWDDLKKLSPMYWAFEGMKKVADRTEERRRLGPAARGSAPSYMGPAPMAPRGMAGGGLPRSHVGYDEYDEARRRYLESGGVDAPEEAGQGWRRIRDWFANHPLLNGSYDAQRTPPAPRGSAPAYMGPGTPGAGAGTDFVMPDAAVPATPRTSPGPSTGGGITSLRASASGKVSPGGPAPAGFTTKDIQLRSIQDAMKDVPADGSLAEMIADYKARAGDADKRRQDAKYEALMRAGLTMARTPGGLRNSIAVGGLEGLGAYSAGMKEASGLERERMRELAALQQAQSAQALQRYGIANATRFGEAGIADKNQDNRFNAYKTGVESSDRRYAADAGVRAASIRATAEGASGANNAEKYRMDMAKQLRGAVEKARQEVNKNALMALGASPAASPLQRAAYEKAVQEETLRSISTMTLEYPEIMQLYRQMLGQGGGSPAAGGPAIIRGSGPPPGAVIRQSP